MAKPRAWPLPETRWTALYLYQDRGLSAEPPSTAAAALDYYAFDAHRPTPTLGGAISSGEPVMRAGAYDRAAIAERHDVLVFTTTPLDRDLEIGGPVGYGSRRMRPTPISPQSCSMSIRRARMIRTGLR